MSMQDQPDPVTHNCSTCNLPVSCGHELGRERCWCDDLPKLPLAGITGKRCLCPACLQQTLEAHSRKSDC